MIPVNAEVIERVVTMGGGRENRTEQKSGRTEFDGIVQTLPDMAETMEHADRSTAAASAPTKPTG
jgi:hypothetical protein